MVTAHILLLDDDGTLLPAIYDRFAAERGQGFCIYDRWGDELSHTLTSLADRQKSWDDKILSLQGFRTTSTRTTTGTEQSPALSSPSSLAYPNRGMYHLRNQSVQGLGRHRLDTMYIPMEG